MFKLKAKPPKVLGIWCLVFCQLDLGSALGIFSGTFQDIQCLSFLAVMPLDHKATLERQKLIRYTHFEKVLTPSPMKTRPHEGMSCFPA